jgi:fatty acid desaturase
MTFNTLRSPGAGDEENTARGSDYAVLARQVRKAGMLKRRPGYYSMKIAANLGMLGLAGTVFVLLGHSWWQMFVAAFLGIVFTQIAFVGHDAGHRQIAGSRRVNDLLGLLHGNLLIGLSYGWWVAKHNRHHGHPNQVGRDPDIAVGAFVFTLAEARRRRGLARWLTCHQAYLFFPILLLEGLNLHVASVRELAARRDRTAAAEALLLLAHATAYLTAVAVVLSPLKAAVFVLVHQALFGLYLGCAFAPNHKGMPILSDNGSSFLRRQVLTARNVRGGRITDVVFGGLNYQIEHHLFPRMPQRNLRQSQPLIREFCRGRGISYREDSVLGSYRQALRYLHGVGAPLRNPTPEKRMMTDLDIGRGTGRLRGSQGARE